MVEYFFVYSKNKSPLWPPVFRNNLTWSICILWSTALHMSYSVRQAIETAVRASISTPVLDEVEAVPVTRSLLSAGCISICTSTLFSGNGWHKGIKFDVCFAPIIPANCAMVITSPFFINPCCISSMSIGKITEMSCFPTLSGEKSGEKIEGWEMQSAYMPNSCSHIGGNDWIWTSDLALMKRPL